MTDYTCVFIYILLCFCLGLSMSFKPLVHLYLCILFICFALCIGFCATIIFVIFVLFSFTRKSIFELKKKKFIISAQLLIDGNFAAAILRIHICYIFLKFLCFLMLIFLLSSFLILDSNLFALLYCKWQHLI